MLLGTSFFFFSLSSFSLHLALRKRFRNCKNNVYRGHWKPIDMTMTRDPIDLSNP